ncbi:signal peptidase I [Brevibacillus laterosporus]|nr:MULTISPECIES: signal peptidase I [Brevibacillus]CCF16242.1 signal peptidase I [Brevibacillus laterosporus GI-9]AUM63421.1 signal peptidase I [Brevibacillus laterosporus]MBA4534850.1 signal peptidase I [Brevibacillus halotolerans]MCR8965616.1 signal peptidase I [Brevibacillus laterosporus]MCR8997709.1 signal peptidase I [Brevibacillus laterosporus]
MEMIKLKTKEKDAAPNQPKKSFQAELFSWLRFFLILAVCYFLMINSIGLTRVVGHSMDPTMQDGSIVLLNKVPTHFTKPAFGDVVVIHEEAKGYEIIKRIIGLPGDTVKIEKGVVYVNNSPLPELYTQGVSDDMAPLTILQDHMFVLGDNRTLGESMDSRDPSIGQIPITEIKGYVSLSLFPFYRVAKPLEV